MRRKQGSTTAVVVAAGLVLAATAARAQGRAGLQFHPRVGVQGQFDSNIFLQPTAPESSLIMSITPGFGLLLEGKRSLLHADADFSYAHYLKFPSVNDASTLNTAFGGQVEFASSGILKVDEGFLMTRDPATSELTARERRIGNTAALRADLPLGPLFFLGIDGSHTLTKYAKKYLADQLDRQEILVGPRLGVLGGPKTKIYASYRYQMVNYAVRDNADSTGSQIVGGIEGIIATRVKGVAEAGVTMRKYSHTLTGQPDSQSSPFARVDLGWEAPNGFKVTLNANRGFQEGQTTRLYVTTGGGAGVTKTIGKAWTAGLRAAYGMDQYQSDAMVSAFGGPAVKRADGNLTVGADATYQVLEQYRLNAAFVHRGRTSNVPAFKFNDELGTIGLTASF